MFELLFELLLMTLAALLANAALKRHKVALGSRNGTWLQRRCLSGLPPSKIDHGGRTAGSHYGKQSDRRDAGNSSATMVSIFIAA
jgi:hypothetical protein